MFALVASFTECNSIRDIEAQARITGPWLDVMGMKVTACRVATFLANKAVSFVDGFAPFLVGERCSTSFTGLAFMIRITKVRTILTAASFHRLHERLEGCATMEANTLGTYLGCGPGTCHRAKFPLAFGDIYLQDSELNTTELAKHGSARKCIAAYERAEPAPPVCNTTWTDTEGNATLFADTIESGSILIGHREHPLDVTPGVFAALPGFPCRYANSIMIRGVQ